MADMHWLNFEPNLQKQSALGVAAFIWGIPVIKNETEQYSIVTVRKMSNIFTSELEWRKVVDKALDQVDLLNLPSKMVSEVKQLIVFTGEKIFLWFVHCISELSLNYKFALKIHWTPHGIIDEKRIFDDWKIDPTFPSLPEPYESKVVLYALASVHVDVDFLKTNLKDVAETIKAYIGLKINDISKFKVNSAMAALLIWYIVDSEQKTGNSLRFSLYYSRLKESSYKAGTDKLFLYCVKANLDKAAEYFYQKLKESDRQKILPQAGAECIANSSGKDINHTTERNSEILLYILNKMPIKEKRLFLMMKIVDVYTMFLNTWPYQQLCPALLDYVWDKLFFEQQFQILQNTVKLIKCFSKTRNKMYQFVLRPKFENVMRRSSFSLKETCFYDNSLIYELFQIPDFEIIKIIVSDPDLKKMRFQTMDISDQLDTYLEEGGSFERIKEYMEKVDFTAKEKKKFTKFLYETDQLGSLVWRGHLNTVNEIVKWQCDYDDEKIIKRKEVLREEFDSYDICYGLILHGRYDEVDEYFNWLYEGEINNEEVEKVKAKLSKPEFIRENFCRLWVKKRKVNLLLARQSCTKLLKYFYKTDDEMLSFKKEMLVDGENFLKTLFTEGSSHLLKLDEIFDFFSMPADKVMELKEKVKSNMDWWLDKYGDNPRRFLILCALINWVTDTNEEKKNIIRKLMFSPKGTELCFYTFKLDIPEGGISNETKRIFVNEWLKECDMKKMKTKIMKLERNDKVKERDVQKVLEKMDQPFTERPSTNQASGNDSNPEPLNYYQSVLNLALCKAFNGI